MSATVADGTTVFGDFEDSRRRDDFLSYKKTMDEPQKHPLAKLGSDFVVADYALQDRPFFVPIGKGGVLAALENLDRQLVEVGRLGFQ